MTILGRDTTDPTSFRARSVSAPTNLDAFRSAWGNRRGAVMLETLASDPFFGRYSIYAADPITTLNSDDLGRFENYSQFAIALRSGLAGRSDMPPLSDANCESVNSRRSLECESNSDSVSAFGQLAASADSEVGISTSSHDRGTTLANVSGLPFTGGWIGALAYEAGRWIEPKAAFHHHHPWLTLGHWRLYDGAIVHDKLNDSWIVVAAKFGNSNSTATAKAKIEDKLDQLESLLRSPQRTASSVDLTLPTNIWWNMSDADYLANVSRVIEYIHAGDVYQANLSRRLRMKVARSPVDVYLDLGRANSAAFAAFIRLDENDGPATSAILSSSPELLLDVTGDVAMSRPIKGTRPRVNDAEMDDAAQRDLASCIKEQAELNMIIDLVRNDLGRVSEYGSVEVVESGRIEAHPTVFHRTATVRSKLRDNADGFTALAAMYPGGSVTGAPKVRAMQIIHELEPDARGAYCGAIGFMNIDGRLRFNLPIRTMMMHEGELELSVGSGIVADSSPERELEELHAKAAGMLRSLGLGRISG